MKRTRWLNFLVCLPYTLLVSYPYVLIFRFIVWAAKDLRMERDGTLTAVWRPWVVKKRGAKQQALWRWSTTLGHGIIFQPGLRPAFDGDFTKPIETTSVWDHELVHVLQTEDLMMISFIIGLVVFVAVGASTGDWSFAAILGGALWTSGGVWQACWFLTSGFRYGWTLEGVYRQSEHERSARAQTQRWCGAKSWLQVGNR